MAPKFENSIQPGANAEVLLSIADLRAAAETRMLKQSLFFNSGSTAQITVQENSTAYEKYKVRPRVLVDVSNADTSTIVLGRKISFPFAVSPAGLQAMAHPDG
ncbi:(S)-2-hydroxy-acid oxidase [Lachnellula subtilissima]|uniref:(S)-2-hydroxy-acid oxidase n=1 Tax=Lachnellula subtilissima TaxID=602034 RepID=A0A8H8UCS5_9HELO|nr:(S)-2-hydroxy-acid oxidase [Lachnellula subtilissima]